MDLYKELESVINKVKNLTIVHTNNPCMYFEAKVKQWINNPESGDPVKLLNYFDYCLDKGQIEVY